MAVWLVTRLGARRVAAGLANVTVFAAIGVVVGMALAARFAIIAFDIEPGFDVPLIQEAAGQALLAAQNPYHTYIYDSGYPYWPLSAVLGAFGVLAGDARWGLPVADAVTVGGVHRDRAQRRGAGPARCSRRRAVPVELVGPRW